jgi:hypothetical protein
VCCYCKKNSKKELLWKKKIISSLFGKESTSTTEVLLKNFSSFSPLSVKIEGAKRN